MKSIGTAQLSKRTKYNILPGQKWPGFSFALHLLRVQVFYFALLQYRHTQAFTGRFVPSMQLYHTRRKTSHRALQGRFLRLTRSTANDTRPTKADITLSAPRWSTSQLPDALHRYRIPPSRPDAAQVSTAAYHASPAGSRCFPRPEACNLAPVSGQGAPAGTLRPAGQSSGMGRGGRRGTIGGSRRFFFRAFAR